MVPGTFLGSIVKPDPKLSEREYFYDPFGRPRGRSVDSIPNRFAMRLTQSSSPNGRPRCTFTRSDSNSDADCGRFTRASQSRGRSMGQSLSHVVSALSR